MAPLAFRVHNWTWLLVGVLLVFMPMLSSANAAPPGPVEISLSMADDGRQIELGEGQALVIALEANPSTGYGWQMEESGEAILRQIKATFEQTSKLLGAPGKQVLRFEATRAGQATLKLAYRRPWEKDRPPIKTFSQRVRSVGAFRRTSLSTTTLEAQPYLYAPLDNPPMLGLPSSHNWCNLGGCTPIRNQGSCGSCWAFGTVGPLEATIKMWDAQARDLAEQYLVSCASEYNGCGGGWFAHDYHEWKIPAGETTAGAVYEADFAYQARDSSQGVGCDFTPQPHTHHEKIASWAEIDPYYNVPSVSAIKQAIYEHGPVAAAVCVGSAFQGYRNGVFQTNETCSNDVNHAIVLVGWNDAEQTWILRNSWGTGWGESGYMRIKWGTSKIGYGANYIVYGVPSNLAASARSNWINLMWTDNTLAENGFKVERSPGDTSNWMQIAAVLADTVAYTDTDVTCNTVYYYRVRAYTSVADSPYSSIANATACASAPTAPGNFCAAAASATRINLTWVDNSSVETGFKIERSPDGTHDWTQIATVGANVTDYSNTGLTCDTIYYYRIRAYNAGGDSGYSNTANAMTLGCSSCADSYETDDDSLSARPITVTDAAQTHNFHVAGDVDWVKFTATEDQTYSAMTSNLDNGNDTVLELYSTDGTTMLAWNDECPGMQAASCINDWTAPGSGVYYIKVREHRSDRGGCTGYDYDVGVSGSRIRVYLPLVTRSKTAR